MCRNYPKGRAHEKNDLHFKRRSMGMLTQLRDLGRNALCPSGERGMTS